MSEPKVRPYDVGPEESVLSTMREDGSRRWMRPRLSVGVLYYRRWVVAWILMVVFLIIPHLRMNGKPLMLFDLPQRQFTLFGTTFFATDTLLLLFLILGLLLAIFLFTALFGRVWCGWACPQTVYMEFLFRPIERWIEGPPSHQKMLDKQGLFSTRRLIKYAIFLLLSMVLAHAFLAYFVGTSQLWQWMQRSPLEHPATFGVMVVTTGLIFFDFAYFREQTCLVACPYGRFQSVLLDKQSAIVAYDYNRGEPRARKVQRQEAPTGSKADWGDCIDCQACVVTCPTGIDIRKGLQMECINCTQCIDACDDIMDKINKPRGLIRYASQQALETQKPLRMLRPRVFLYPLVIVAIFVLLGFSLSRRDFAVFTVLRGGKDPYTLLQQGVVNNQLKIKIVNRTNKAATYTISLEAPDRVKLIAPMNPVKVEAYQSQTSIVFVTAPQDLFEAGQLAIRWQVTDGGSYRETQGYKLLGPSRTSLPK